MPGEKQAEKPTTQERLKQITDKIEAGIRDLFASDQYRAYLSTMSRFHQYSFNNSVLIYLQNPKATRVASYTKWKDSFGRQVKRGEHGITIIAPTPYKKKVEEVKTDPDTKLPLLDKDGREIRIRSLEREKSEGSILDHLDDDAAVSSFILHNSVR